MKRLVPFAFVLASTGCASIFSGTTQEVAIRTTPGAAYTVTDTYGKQVASGLSQGTANLERGVGYFSPHAYKARITKPGYKTQTIDINPSLNPWYFGNILFGGFVGMVIVDPLTGAMYKFFPSQIDAPLEPSGATGSIESSQPAPLPRASRQSSIPAPVAISRYEYPATERAKAQGCKPTAAPAFDGVKDPHETLLFNCEDGRNISVSCTISGCT